MGNHGRRGRGGGEAGQHNHIKGVQPPSRPHCWSLSPCHPCMHAVCATCVHKHRVIARCSFHFLGRIFPLFGSYYVSENECECRGLINMGLSAGPNGAGPNGMARISQLVRMVWQESRGLSGLSACKGVSAARVQRVRIGQACRT